MTLEEMKARAFGPRGLSANFFGNQKNQNHIMKKNFKINLVNNTSKSLCIALTKGTYPSFEELKKNYSFIDAFASSGEVFTDPSDTSKKCVLSCPESGKTIEHFQEYFSKVVGQIVQLEIISEIRSNLNGEIKYAPTLPFDAPSPESVRLAPYLSVNQQDNTRLLAELKEEGEVIPVTPLSFVTIMISPNSKMEIIIDVEFVINVRS